MWPTFCLDSRAIMAVKSYVKANLTSSGAVGRTVGGLWIGEASSSKYASASFWNEEYDILWKKLLRVGLSFSCKKIRRGDLLVNTVYFDLQGILLLLKGKVLCNTAQQTLQKLYLLGQSHQPMHASYAPVKLHVTSCPGCRKLCHSQSMHSWVMGRLRFSCKPEFISYQLVKHVED